MRTLATGADDRGGGGRRDTWCEGERPRDEDGGFQEVALALAQELMDVLSAEFAELGMREGREKILACTRRRRRCHPKCGLNQAVITVARSGCESLTLRNGVV